MKRKKKKLRKLRVLFVFLLFIVFVFAINNFLNNEKKETNLYEIGIEKNEKEKSKKEKDSIKVLLENDEKTEEEKLDTKFSMAFTGDIMCHNTMYMDAYDQETDTYDFSYFFDDVREYLEKTDITIGNLETTFAGKEVGYSSYPTFNTPETLGDALKDVGFDVLTTANNHCMDKWYSGLESTIDYLDKLEISHTGTFKSKEDQSNILIKNVNGVNIAFLSFTYGTNGIKIPEGKEYAVNLIDKELMSNQLNLAKKTDAEFICVCMHWGIEYQTVPNDEQKELAEFLIKNGADLIIGNHPHVPQSMEIKEVLLDDGSKKEAFVIYSLGNFMADQGKKYTRDSLILNLEYERNGKTGDITLNSATYIPTYIYKNPNKSSKKFKILDMKKSIERYESGENKSIGSEIYQLLKEEIENVRKIVGDEIEL